MLQAIAKILIAPMIFIMSVAGYSVQDQSANLGAYNPSGGGTYRLATSIGSSDTSIKLSSFKEPISNIPYTMSYLNSDIAYGTIAPQSNSSEFISFTGITQNADGTATLTGITRGLGRSFPYTASSTLRQVHSGQSIFILSNAPQLYNEYVTKRNDETISGIKNFSILPTSSLVATTSTQFVTKSLLDSTANAGAATSTESVTGIVRLATALQTASSTASTSNTPYVIQAQNATSTYNSATAPLKVVVTQNNGKIDPNFLDKSANYIWTGNNYSTASTTFLATTTIVASSATNKALVLNTVPYAFPSSQGAASTYLGNDGSGNLTWNSLSTFIWSTTTPAAYTGSSLTVFSRTITANTLGTQNVIKGKFFASWTDSAAATRQLTLTYGGATCAQTNAVDGVDGATYGFVEFMVIESGTNIQRCSLSYLGSNTGASGAINTFALQGTGTASVTQSSNQTLALTIAQNTSGQTLTIDSGLIEVVR